jgi:hypothetical protein
MFAIPPAASQILINARTVQLELAQKDFPGNATNQDEAASRPFKPVWRRAGISGPAFRHPLG